MSREDGDDRLEQLVRDLIPVAKRRLLRSPDISPETFAVELWSLSGLYTVLENLRKQD